MTLARCTGERACPRRWADGGPDRDCGEHGDCTDVNLAAFDGEHDGSTPNDGDRQAADGHQAGGQAVSRHGIARR